MGGFKEPGRARVCIGRHPDPEAGVAAVTSGRLTAFWVTTLRTSSASVIASPLGPVHLAAVTTDCRENVEAARMLTQLLRHLRLTVDSLPQCPVASGSCGISRRTLFWLRAKRECASVAGASMEVCSAQRAGMDSAWGSRPMTVPGGESRARVAPGGAAAAAGGWYRIITAGSRCERQP